jgi:ribosomal protein S18 acetylase RimI-like enzyme
MMAWAVLQSPFWCIDYAIHPMAPPNTYSEVLTWADRRALAVLNTPFSRPMWFTQAFKGHSYHETLESFGFLSQENVGEDSWTKVLLRRKLTLLPQPKQLAEGFHIRPLNGVTEVDAYVALHRLVFESESMTSSWRQRTLVHPQYMPQLDLVLVDNDNRLAGFCIGWFSSFGPERQPSGQIEPMGIRADVRGKGLGTSLLLECLARLSSLGATSVFVEADNYRDAAFNLYTTAGFEGFRDVIVYRKDYKSAGD